MDAVLLKLWVPVPGRPAGELRGVAVHLADGTEQTFASTSELVEWLKLWVGQAVDRLSLP